MTDSIVQPLKRCTKCGEEKPATTEYFSAKQGRPYGIRSFCKVCQSLDGHRYRREHQSQIKEAQAEYRGKNRDQIRTKARDYAAHIQANDPERRRNANRRWRTKNAQYERERGRAYYWANTDKRRQWSKDNRDSKRLSFRKWRIANPEKDKTRRSVRRARECGLPNTLTAFDWQHALHYFGDRCAVCNRPRGLWHTLAQDHWIPLSKQGGTTPDNIIPLCHGEGGCNNSKSNKDAALWLVERFGEQKAQVILKRIQDYFDSLT